MHALAGATPALGDSARLWFGWKPRGGIYFYPSRQEFGPFQLWVNSGGRLRVNGNWRTWPMLYNDERFAALAALLGQSHLEGSRGVAVTDLDVEEFWRVAVECDEAINYPYTDADK